MVNKLFLSTIPLRKICLALLLMVASLQTFAQGTLTLSGTVKDDKGGGIPSATVFLSGTTRRTASSIDGKYTFDKLAPGTYQLSVSMIGFEAYAKSIVIKDGSVLEDVVLNEKTNSLNEVVISPAARDRNYALFRTAFLGRSDNARSCRILNPEVLSFYDDRTEKVLTAEASDLLVIENERLGYRIKYLLKYFKFDHTTRVILYDGETSFEELEGTAADKRKWARNRAETYDYSMMHFLRAVYEGDLQKEGFVAYEVSNVSHDPNTRTVKFDGDPPRADLKKLTQRVDTSFVALRFQHLFVRYDPSQTKRFKRDRDLERGLPLNFMDKGTVITMIAKEALIDRRGSYTFFRTFLLEGGMAAKQVGDRLPFEYWP